MNQVCAKAALTYRSILTRNGRWRVWSDVANAFSKSARLDPNKLAAIGHLLEVMIHDDTEPVAEEDRRRFQEGPAWFAHRGGNGIPMEDVISEFGLKPEDFPLNR